MGFWRPGLPSRPYRASVHYSCIMGMNLWTPSFKNSNDNNDNKKPIGPKRQIKIWQYERCNRSVTEKLTMTALQKLFSSSCTDGDECSRAAASSALCLFLLIWKPQILWCLRKTLSPDKGSYCLRVSSVIGTQFLNCTQQKAKKN